MTQMYVFYMISAYVCSPFQITTRLSRALACYGSSAVAPLPPTPPRVPLQQAAAEHELQLRNDNADPTNPHAAPPMLRIVTDSPRPGPSFVVTSPDGEAKQVVAEPSPRRISSLSSPLRRHPSTTPPGMRAERSPEFYAALGHTRLDAAQQRVVFMGGSTPSNRAVSMRASVERKPRTESLVLPQDQFTV
jgi:hypothetical protein